MKAAWARKLHQPKLRLTTQSEPLSGLPAVKLTNVTIHYGDTVAIENANLEVGQGKILALVGPSGCGKSSLLHSINRMTDMIPNCKVQGEILVNDNNILLKSTDVYKLRSQVGMVFQQPNPFPMSIRENIQFPLKEHGIRQNDKLAAITEKSLRNVGLWDEVSSRLHQSALNLSGGQQQRLCIARALALEPQVLLFDEPCSALDPISSKIVEALIVSLKQHYTVIIVTHNLAQARRVADRVAVCWVDQGCGCVIETGDTQAIFERAKHPITIAYCRGDEG